MLAAAPGNVLIGTQPVKFWAHVLPPSPSANCGDPWNTIPRSVDTLKCRPLLGKRFPKPMPSVGAVRFSVIPAVPVIGFAALLKYLVPPSVKLWPPGTDTVA